MKTKFIISLCLAIAFAALVLANPSKPEPAKNVDTYGEHQQYCYHKCTHYKSVKGKCSDYEWQNTKKECCGWEIIGKGKCLKYKRFSKCDKYSKARKLCLGHGKFEIFTIFVTLFQVTNKFATSTRLKSIVSSQLGRIYVHTRVKTMHVMNMPIISSVPNMTSHMSVPNTLMFQKLVITTRRDVLNTSLMLTVLHISKFVNVKRDGRKFKVNTTRDGLIPTIMPSVNKNVTRFVLNIPRLRSVSDTIRLNSV